MSDPKKDKVSGVETTGHSWDGIEELNNPLPRWWLWTFYLTIIWGVAYSIAYPAWPMISGATAGLLGYSTRGEVAQEIIRAEAKNAHLASALSSADLTNLPQDEELQQYAVAAGGAVFRTYCSQCHGSGAGGAIGYPNLLDDDWLWGGGAEEIALTVRHGIRAEADPETRYSQMPAFEDILEDDEIADLVHHIHAISGQPFEDEAAGRGAVLFEENCAACHGADGTGDREQGAPNLTDAIWLYGGDDAALTQTINKARFGVMPGWSDKLTPAQINAVATYVHQLGGGE